MVFVWSGSQVFSIFGLVLCGVSIAVLSSCSSGYSELSSVLLLRFIWVLSFDRRGLIVRRFMVGFYLGGKWTLESTFKPYPKGGLDRVAILLVGLWSLGSWVWVRDGIVWQAIGDSDRSELRRRGVLGSISGWYCLACQGQHQYIQFSAFCYLGGLLHWIIL